MSHEVEKVVAEFRKAYNITDGEVKEVLELCRRKIGVTGQEESYLELLLPDELKNHCFRRAVNMAMVLRRMGKEAEACVQCAGVTHV